MNTRKKNLKKFARRIISGVTMMSSMGLTGSIKATGGESTIGTVGTIGTLGVGAVAVGVAVKNMLDSNKTSEKELAFQQQNYDLNKKNYEKSREDNVVFQEFGLNEHQIADQIRKFNELLKKNGAKRKITKDDVVELARNGSDGAKKLFQKFKKR